MRKLLRGVGGIEEGNVAESGVQSSSGKRPIIHEAVVIAQISVIHCMTRLRQSKCTRVKPGGLKLPSVMS